MLDEFGNQINDIAEISDLIIFFTILQIKEYVFAFKLYFADIFNGITLHFIIYGSDRLIVKLSKTEFEAATDTLAQHQNGMELTQEQRDMLFEDEEFMTTNAMRAVCGYVPTDDQRLCPHYDPRTGACWKGNTCTFEHGPKLAGK